MRTDTIYKIRGFLHPVDATIIETVADWQTAHRIHGSVAEIGVFYGRSFALLAMMLQPAEYALAIDLFDIDQQEGQESGQLKAFRETLRTNPHVHRDQCFIISRDSNTVQASDIVRMVGNVRLFSVDGGHELPHIRNDSVLAIESIGDDGVIIFDDFMNAQYPNVSVGVLEFLERYEGIVKPFGLSRNKLYICRTARYADYISCLSDMHSIGGMTMSRFLFLEHDVIFWDQPLVKRAAYETLARLGLGRIARAALRQRLPRFHRPTQEEPEK